jgi:hypothetical protein
VIDKDRSAAKTTARISGSTTILSVLATLIDRLDSDAVIGTGIIPWSCPVPTFGDLTNPQLATLGINPSYREFVDRSGEQLQGELRRFHTLDSLGLEAWAEADARHLELILDTYRSYFFCNPYDAWFKKLDFAISGANVSYYDSPSTACHLDLIPFATVGKWTELSAQQRSSLLALSGDTLGMILRDSQVRVLVLNGSSVVKGFQLVAGVSLQAEEIPSWSLGRRSSANVKGVAYTGVAATVSGIKLDRQLQVLGFNHNLQSSFGVTMEVITAIREWITQTTEATGW